MTPAYPTPEHARAAERVVQFFAGQPGVEAVLLTCSCARGKATRDSCLDMAVILSPALPDEDRELLRVRWEDGHPQDAVFEALKQAGLFSQVEVTLSDGVFAPGKRGWTAEPDNFELEIGNLLRYSVPLWVPEAGLYLEELKARWLPYYEEPLRRVRLAETRRFCLNNLRHIPPFVSRGLYFQAFYRLAGAFREFMQALFIARRTYPVAYDKWIHEQVAEILGLPELYVQLPPLFEIGRLESDELIDKARALEGLLEAYAPAGGAEA